MAECGECGADLDPAWKFCIRCGTSVAVTPRPDTDPVPSARPDPSPNPGQSPAPAPAPAARTEIPSAIRPHLHDESRGDDELESDRPTFDIPLVLGIAIGVFGVIAMATGFIILIGRN